VEKNNEARELVWHKILEIGELPEGRVMSALCEHLTVRMTHYQGKYAALDNNCPHQGGPLGEGSIENGLLRCPWHDWDFDPLTGKTPGYDDGAATYPVEVRADGVFVGLVKEQAHVRTLGDLMMETLTNWGIRQVFGIVGSSNLGIADALRIQEQQGKPYSCHVTWWVPSVFPFRRRWAPGWQPTTDQASSKFIQTRNGCRDQCHVTATTSPEAGQLEINAGYPPSVCSMRESSARYIAATSRSPSIGGRANIPA
jgi:nitrite reductase/ring-hydroxylating ferredoxin subunit